MKRAREHESKAEQEASEPGGKRTKYVSLELLGDKTWSVGASCFERKDVEVEIREKISSGRYGSVFASRACSFASASAMRTRSACREVVVKVMAYSDQDKGLREEYKTLAKFKARFKAEVEASKAASAAGLGPAVLDHWLCNTTDDPPGRTSFLMMEDLSAVQDLTHEPLDQATQTQLLRDLMPKLLAWMRLGWRHHDLHQGNVLVNEAKTRAWIIDHGHTERVGELSEEERKERKPLTEWAKGSQVLTHILNDGLLPADSLLHQTEIYELDNLLDAFRFSGHGTTTTHLSQGEEEDAPAQPEQKREALASKKATETRWQSIRQDVLDPREVAEGLRRMKARQPCRWDFADPGARVTRLVLSPPRHWIVTTRVGLPVHVGARLRRRVVQALVRLCAALWGSRVAVTIAFE